MLLANYVNIILDSSILSAFIIVTINNHHNNWDCFNDF